MKINKIIHRAFYSSVVLLSFLFFIACSQDDEKVGNTGVIRLGVQTNTSVITKADPVAIKLTIKSKEEGWFKTYDYDGGEMDIELSAGEYEIVATSGNNNNDKAGFDIPYYMGKKDVAVVAGKTNSATIECTLTTVKISIEYGDDIKAAFPGGFKTIVKNNSGELAFGQDETRSGYFTPGELSVTFSYKNGSEWTDVEMKKITEAKAREHYTLKFSVKSIGENPGEEGAGNVDIEIESENAGSVNINIKLPTPKGTALEPNVWAKFAYLKGEINKNIDPSTARFEWRRKGEEQWNAVNYPVTKKDGIYQTLLTNGDFGLEPDNTYEYRFEEGEPREFTTSNTPIVPNLNFDTWTTAPSGLRTKWFPNADASNSYWATGNEGVLIMANANTVGKETTPGSSEMYAEMSSVKIFLVGFAAGNLYTGTYSTVISAPIKSARFGRDYTGRPTKLSGYFKYEPKEVNIVEGKDKKPGYMDKCEIYIRLFQDIPDSEGGRYDGSTVPTDAIAFGSFSTDQNVTEWTRFEIPIVYDDLESIPTKIAIVSTSSIEGAFFTGGVGSKLCVDNFELSFDYDPRIEGQ